MFYRCFLKSNKVLKLKSVGKKNSYQANKLTIPIVLKDKRKTSNQESTSSNKSCALLEEKKNLVTYINKGQLAQVNEQQNYTYSCTLQKKCHLDDEQAPSSHQSQ